MSVLTILSLAVITSCKEPFPVRIDSKEKEFFLYYSEEEGLYSKGQPLLIYNASTHQRTDNRKRRQYRFQTDLQEIYMNIYLEKIPKETGVKINTNLDFRSPEHAISNANTMECSKIVQDKFWLWDASTKTGVILKLR